MSESRLTFFDLVNAINKKTAINWAEDEEKAYEPFMVNRAYSLHSETALVANEMNQFPSLDKKMQFDFYRELLPKRERFAKWDKFKESNDIKLIVEMYSVSTKVAEEMVDLLDSCYNNWREEYTEILDKGGRRK